MTPHIERVLDGFNHRVNYRQTVRQPWRGRDSTWVYPLFKAAMAEVGLQEVETYVSSLQKNVAQFIATRTIMELYLAAERRPGSRVTNQWWEQDGLDVERRQIAAQEEEWAEGEKETDGTDTETD